MIHVSLDKTRIPMLITIYAAWAQTHKGLSRDQSRGKKEHPTVVSGSEFNRIYSHTTSKLLPIDRSAGQMWHSIANILFFVVACSTQQLGPKPSHQFEMYS